jgi:hypothetical protein
VTTTFGAFGARRARCLAKFAARGAIEAGRRWYHVWNATGQVMIT